MKRLRQERLRRGWSLQKLGEKAGMQGSDISKVERGIVMPYPSQRRRLAKAIGCAPDELLEEVSDVEPAVSAH
jgi:transcriptional regulator with XRE-family HTH domain